MSSEANRELNAVLEIEDSDTEEHVDSVIDDLRTGAYKATVDDLERAARRRSGVTSHVS